MRRATTVTSAVSAFRALHESGCFVIPNPWDAGTAIYLHHLGFSALATTSAGFAFSRGLPDDLKAVPRDAMLAHVREINGALGGPLDDHAIVRLFERVIDEARRIQRIEAERAGPPAERLRTDAEQAE